ncbi:hypothetical protein KIH41_05695 [Litoribacter ruber]|nr:hypothetical protein [Litoribacter ruber]
MDRFIKISFLMIYLLFNAGLSYSMHYCGEKLETVKVSHEHSKCCSEQDVDPDCCLDVDFQDQQNRDQVLLALVDYQFQKVDFSFAISDFIALLQKLSIEIKPDREVLDETDLFAWKTPIHIQNQTFLI